mmetsp:Transcript_3753/g.14240  ORF Transcript_3753/g.14240 Transcript_3753/m.14240 type:complete len:87 (+) Transcript_3753:865-1125(+)
MGVDMQKFENDEFENLSEISNIHSRVFFSYPNDSSEGDSSYHHNRSTLTPSIRKERRKNATASFETLLESPVRAIDLCIFPSVVLI